MINSISNSVFTDVYTLITNGATGINRPTYSIGTSIYPFITNTTGGIRRIANFIRCSTDIVSIRIITDRLQSAGKYSLVPYLEEQGFDIVKNKKHKIMHNKFAIFDGKRIENGSYNWTKNASESNAENCSFFEQQDKIYTNQFEYLWDLYQE